jgi:hypothetical protein
MMYEGYHPPATGGPAKTPMAARETTHTERLDGHDKLLEMVLERLTVFEERLNDQDRVLARRVGVQSQHWQQHAEPEPAI